MLDFVSELFWSSVVVLTIIVAGAYLLADIPPVELINALLELVALLEG